MTAAHAPSQATRRPYWLLLVLALFLAGQIASAQHWHNASDAVDYNCALCVLSGTNTCALNTNTWQAPAIIVCTFVSCYYCVAIHRAVVRFNDARAPPLYS